MAQSTDAGRDELDRMRSTYRRSLKQLQEYKTVVRLLLQSLENDTPDAQKLAAVKYRARIAAIDKDTGAAAAPPHAPEDGVVAPSAGRGTGRGSAPTIAVPSAPARTETVSRSTAAAVTAAAAQETSFNAPIRYLKSAQRFRASVRQSSGKSLLAAMQSASVAETGSDATAALPFLAAFHVLEALPPASAGVLARTNKRWLQMVRQWRVHAERVRLVMELRDNEAAFLDDLRQIQRISAELLLSGVQRVAIPSGVSQLLCERVPLLKHISKQFLAELVDRLQDDWNVEQSTIGDLFLVLAPSMQAYRVYAQEHSNVSSALTRTLHERRLVGDVDGPLDDLDELEVLLTRPLDRLTYYASVVNDLRDVTEGDHPDQLSLLSASTALQQLRAVYNASAVNASSATAASSSAPGGRGSVRRTVEEAAAIASLRDLPMGLTGEIAIRTLLKHERAVWLKRKVGLPGALADSLYIRKKVTLLLMPDLLLVAGKRDRDGFKFMASLAIGSCMVSPLPPDGRTYAVSIISAALAVPLIVEFKTAKAQQSWVKMVAHLTSERRGTAPAVELEHVRPKLAPSAAATSASVTSSSSSSSTVAPVAHAVVAGAVVKEGWLEKKRSKGVVSYQRLYAMLSSVSLMFFKREGKDLKSEVDLATLMSVTLLASDATGASLAIVTKSKELVLRAESADEAKSWLDVLRETAGRTGKGRAQDGAAGAERIVDIALPDGTTCVMMLREHETSESLLAHICMKRRLDISRFQLVSEATGLTMSPRSSVDTLAGQSFKLVPKDGPPFEGIVSPRGKKPGLSPGNSVGRTKRVPGTTLALSTSGATGGGASPRAKDEVASPRSKQQESPRGKSDLVPSPRKGSDGAGARAKQGDSSPRGLKALFGLAQSSNSPLGDEPVPAPVKLERSASVDSFSALDTSLRLRVELPDHSFATLLLTEPTTAAQVLERACHRRLLDAQAFVLMDDRGAIVSNDEVIDKADALRVVPKVFMAAPSSSPIATASTSRTHTPTLASSMPPLLGSSRLAASSESPSLTSSLGSAHAMSPPVMGGSRAHADSMDSSEVNASSLTDSGFSLYVGSPFTGERTESPLKLSSSSNMDDALLASSLTRSMGAPASAMESVQPRPHAATTLTQSSPSVPTAGVTVRKSPRVAVPALAQKPGSGGPLHSSSGAAIPSGETETVSPRAPSVDAPRPPPGGRVSPAPRPVQTRVNPGAATADAGKRRSKTIGASALPPPVSSPAVAPTAVGPPPIATTTAPMPAPRTATILTSPGRSGSTGNTGK